jgi:hypothetical protein
LTSHRQKALEAGFDAVMIAKPCLPDELAGAIETILAGPRTA